MSAITELDYALNCAAIEIDTTNARSELAQLRAAAAEAQAAHVYLDESPVNSHDEEPFDLSERIALLVTELLNARARIDELERQTDVLK